MFLTAVLQPLQVTSRFIVDMFIAALKISLDQVNSASYFIRHNYHGQYFHVEGLGTNNHVRGNDVYY